MKKSDTIHILVFNNATLKIYFSYIMKLIYEEKGIAFDFFPSAPTQLHTEFASLDYAAGFWATIRPHSGTLCCVD